MPPRRLAGRHLRPRTHPTHQTHHNRGVDHHDAEHPGGTAINVDIFIHDDPVTLNVYYLPAGRAAWRTAGAAARRAALERVRDAIDAELGQQQVDDLDAKALALADALACSVADALVDALDAARDRDR